MEWVAVLLRIMHERGNVIREVCLLLYLNIFCVAQQVFL